MIRPNCPVLHLAIGLAVALDVRSKQLAAEMGAPETWEHAGYVTYRVGAGEDPTPLPMVTIDHFLREPEIAMRAVLCGQALEAAAAAVQAKAGFRTPPVHLRLV